MTNQSEWNRDWHIEQTDARTGLEYVLRLLDAPFLQNYEVDESGFHSSFAECEVNGRHFVRGLYLRNNVGELRPHWHGLIYPILNDPEIEFISSHLMIVLPDESAKKIYKTIEDPPDIGVSLCTGKNPDKQKSDYFVYIRLEGEPYEKIYRSNREPNKDMLCDRDRFRPWAKSMTKSLEDYFEGFKECRQISRHNT